MWIVCITSVRHVLTVNGYGGRQTKENEKSWCFKGWETLVIYEQIPGKVPPGKAKLPFFSPSGSNVRMYEMRISYTYTL